MPRLLHHPLSAPSRIIRLLLGEKGVAFTAEIEKPWEARPAFLALSVGAELPVFIEDDGFALSGLNATSRYLEETHPEPHLCGKAPRERAKILERSSFFTTVFARDVVATLVTEKAMRRLQGKGVPSAALIRQGYAALDEHMKYLSWLAEQNDWLAGETMTLADLAAAAHISILDYLGDVPWDRYSDAKHWYARIKSRPSFRPLLADHIPGLPPPTHYANLDF